MARRVLLDALVARTAKLRSLSWTVILLPDEEPHRDVYAAHLRHLVLDRRTGQFTFLPQKVDNPEGALMARFQQKTRNLVRKSLMQGFEEMVTNEVWAWDFLADTHRTKTADVRYSTGRVEDGRGSLGPMAITPFPIPAHRTGRTGFRYPALRLASPHGPQRGRSGQAF
jgi:hypothetical protein